MASAAVLDASAILAVIFNEPGCDVVLPVLDGGLVSAVSLAEVHARLLLRGAGSDFAWRRVMDLGCEICAFGDGQARVAAELIAEAHRFGLSLGGRACLALAIQRKTTVYTTDSSWKKLNLGIEVEVIR